MIFCARATRGRGLPSLGLMARLGVPVGGRVRKPRAYVFFPPSGGLSVEDLDRSVSNKPRFTPSIKHTDAPIISNIPAAHRGNPSVQRPSGSYSAAASCAKPIGRNCIEKSSSLVQYHHFPTPHLADCSFPS